MGIVLGVIIIFITLLACGWLALDNAAVVMFWVVLVCGLSLGVLMVAAHFLGWGW